MQADGDLTRRRFLHLAGGSVSLALPADATRAAMRDRPPVSEDASAATQAISLTVNGQVHELAVDTRTSLLDLLREGLLMTGTKKGCNQGACGACTVIVDGKRINSCLTLAVMQDGAHIETIEGLASGPDLHPLQAAFIEHEAFQCGYCTSGQIMSGLACIAEGHADSITDIKQWMSGNLCRCGAYPGICSAIRETARTTPAPKA
jgi:xanthine dehydrogenase YagT iron-sulfur-binding subunit